MQLSLLQCGRARSHILSLTSGICMARHLSINTLIQNVNLTTLLNFFRVTMLFVSLGAPINLR